MATDRSMSGNGRGTATLRPGFAPEGTTLVRPLGAGSVFEVALVRDEQGRELVCKRVAPRAREASGDAALDRERDVLRAVKSPFLVEVAAWGSDARGGFVLEEHARGVAVRTLLGAALDAATWIELARASS